MFQNSSRNKNVESKIIEKNANVRKAMRNVWQLFTTFKELHYFRHALSEMSLRTTFVQQHATSPKSDNSLIVREHYVFRIVRGEKEPKAATVGRKKKRKQLDDSVRFRLSGLTLVTNARAALSPIVRALLFFSRQTFCTQLAITPYVPRQIFNFPTATAARYAKLLVAKEFRIQQHFVCK